MRKGDRLISETQWRNISSTGQHTLSWELRIKTGKRGAAPTWRKLFSLLKLQSPTELRSKPSYGVSVWVSKRSYAYQKLNGFKYMLNFCLCSQCPKSYEYTAHLNMQPIWLWWRIAKATAANKNCSKTYGEISMRKMIIDFGLCSSFW